MKYNDNELKDCPCCKKLIKNSHLQSYLGIQKGVSFDLNLWTHCCGTTVSQKVEVTNENKKLSK